MLDSLRIRAETHVLHWSKDTEYQGGSKVCDEPKSGRKIKGDSNSECDQDDIVPDIMDSKKSTKPATSHLKLACEMVRCRSSKTAVTFLYLAKPPLLQVRRPVSKEDTASEAENYLSNLETLTNHWPPTLLVRGVSPVTSTTL